MFKNAFIYRIEHWEPPLLADFEKRLNAARFVACGASQPESWGWVAPRGEGHAALAESVGGQLILKLATEFRAVPGHVVKDEVEAELKKIEAETGRRPKGKRVKELKEQVTHALLPRAFPKRGETLIWVDAQAKTVVVGAGSSKKADAVLTRLLDLLAGGCRLATLQTQLAPSTAMAQWLSEKESPAGFTIDRDCELKAPEGEKPAVRYARHTLELDEIAEHIRQGKTPTRLALTWQGRVSFVLTEALTLKGIKLLDVALEGAGADASANQGDDSFDADVALMTGELAQLIPQLLEALGGLQLEPVTC